MTILLTTIKICQTEAKPNISSYNKIRGTPSVFSLIRGVGVGESLRLSWKGTVTVLPMRREVAQDKKGWTGDDPGKSPAKCLVPHSWAVNAEGPGSIHRLQCSRLHLRVFPVEIPEENQCGQLRGLRGLCWNTGHTTLLGRCILDDQQNETLLSKYWQ